MHSWGSKWASTGGVAPVGPLSFTKQQHWGQPCPGVLQQQSFLSTKWEHKSLGTKGWKCSWASWILPLLPMDGTCMKLASFQGARDANISFFKKKRCHGAKAGTQRSIPTCPACPPLLLAIFPLFLSLASPCAVCFCLQKEA